jgi:hypothetical protein
VSDPTLTPSPILDDKTATHAILRANEGEPQTCSTACDLDVAGSLSLPDYTGGWATVSDLPGAIAAGVNCLICLGWLGARHATPPVIVKGSWFPQHPPTLNGETNEAYTDRLTGAATMKYLREHGADMGRLTFADVLTAQVPPEVTMPYDHTRNRRCSINYHDECSDPAGESCECPCHRQPAAGTVIDVGGTAMVVMPLDSPSDGFIDKIMDDVLDELMKARELFPGQHLPLGFGEAADGFIAGVLPYRSADLRDVYRNITDHASDVGRLTWRHVLTEEAFEAFAEDDTAKARGELAQLAAMAIRAMLDIDDPQPVHYTGPSGVAWDQVGTDPEGVPVVKRHVNQQLTPAEPAAPASADATEAPGA